MVSCPRVMWLKDLFWVKLRIPLPIFCYVTSASAWKKNWELYFKTAEAWLLSSLGHMFHLIIFTCFFNSRVKALHIPDDLVINAKDSERTRTPMSELFAHSWIWGILFWSKQIWQKALWKLNRKKCSVGIHFQTTAMIQKLTSWFSKHL